MILSLALIFILGITLGKIFKLMRMPSLVGMILTGIILGPYALNLLDPTIINISPDLRQIALIIILTRAGLNLNIKQLKKVGRPAILMCFVPACFEIIGTIIIAPKLLGVTVLEAAIIGAVLAAVSPAVIVPRMLNLVDNGYGAGKSIPQMIMAAASVDDVFVIVLFSAFTGIAQGEKVSVMSFLNIPISILLGILVGILVGMLISYLIKKVNANDIIKSIILLSVSFILVTIEHRISHIVSFSGLIAVMALATTMHVKSPEVSKRLSQIFSKLWVGAEIILFVLVGATVNIEYALKAGVLAILLIVLVLLVRTIGVFVSLIKTGLNSKEKIFCAISYMPKATVQAAIGGAPLAMGLACGNVVLTIAVLSILITAPIGAFLIDKLYKKLLTKK